MGACLADELVAGGGHVRAAARTEAALAVAGSPAPRNLVLGEHHVRVARLGAVERIELVVDARPCNLIVRREGDDNLIDVLVLVLLLPLVGGEARAEVLRNLLWARDVARLGEDLAVGDVARHLLLEHGAEPVPRALAVSGTAKIYPAHLEEIPLGQLRRPEVEHRTRPTGEDVAKT